MNRTLDPHPTLNATVKKIPHDTANTEVDSKFESNFDGDAFKTATEDTSTLPNPQKDSSENSRTIEDWANSGTPKWDDKSNTEPTWGVPVSRPNIFQFIGPSLLPYTHVPI